MFIRPAADWRVPDVRLEQFERYTHRRHERQGLDGCLCVIHPESVPHCPRSAKWTQEDRSIHIPTSTLRSRTHTDRWSTSHRRSVHTVLLRNMGQIRAGSHISRRGSQISHRKASVLPLSHTDGLSYVQSRERRRRNHRMRNRRRLR